MTDQELYILIQGLWSFTLIIGMKLVIFVIGYKVVKLGYDLLSKGVEGKFKFSAEIQGVKADLVSVSPGLLFVLLGCFLIGFALFVDKELKLEFPTIQQPQNLAPPRDLAAP